MKRILLALAFCFTSVESFSATTLYMRTTTQGVTLDGDGVQARGLSTTRGSTMTTYAISSTDGPVGDLGTAEQQTTTAGGNRASWLSDPWAATTLTGTVSFQLTGFESNAAANATFTAELLRVNVAGVIISTIASAQRSNSELMTANTIIAWTTGSVPTTMSAGDRLAVRVYMDDANGVTMATGQTLYFRFNGPTNNAAGDSKVTVSQDLVALDTTATLTTTVSKTFTYTPTISPTPTSSPTYTDTPTFSDTQTASPTWTPTFTHTSVNTPTPDSTLRRGRLLASLQSATDSTSCANNAVLTPVAGRSLVITSLTVRTTSATSHTLTVYGDNGTCSGTILANFTGLGVEVISGSNPEYSVWVGGQKLAADADLAYKTGANITNTDFVDVYGYELDANGIYVSP